MEIKAALFYPVWSTFVAYVIEKAVLFLYDPPPRGVYSNPTLQK